MELIKSYISSLKAMRSATLKGKSDGIYIGYLDGELCLIEYYCSADYVSMEVVMLLKDYGDDEARSKTTFILRDTKEEDAKLLKAIIDGGRFVIHERYTEAINSLYDILKDSGLERLNELLAPEFSGGASLLYYSVSGGQVPPKGLYFFEEDGLPPTVVYITADRTIIDLCYGQLDMSNSNMLDRIYYGGQTYEESYFTALPHTYTVLWEMYNKYLE